MTVFVHEERQFRVSILTPPGDGKISRSMLCEIQLKELRVLKI
jgi:hypothetical protein